MDCSVGKRFFEYSLSKFTASDEVLQFVSPLSNGFSAVPGMIFMPLYGQVMFLSLRKGFPAEVEPSKGMS